MRWWEVLQLAVWLLLGVLVWTVFAWGVYWLSERR